MNLRIVFILATLLFLQESRAEMPGYCDVTFFCSGYVSATGASGTVPNCVCNCRPNFAGRSCENCAPGYYGPFCEYCLPGWSGVAPNCTDQCTNQTSSCNGRSTNLVGSPGACVCTCQAGYNGTRCESCASGYTGWPNCIPDCTSSAVSCNGLADFVEGTPPNCFCRCRNGYGGATCEICAAGFMANPAWPICWDTCTNAANSCNQRGLSVQANPTAPDCLCTCERGYAGDRCEQCAPGFFGYPNCYDNCSNPIVSCSGGGVAVTGTSAPNCLCTCGAVHEGTTCERCIPSRTNWPRCTSCAPGYNPYPVCADNCTNVNVSCSGHAYSVYKAGSCVCNCTRGWTGTKCDVCQSGFAGPRCEDQCIFSSVSCNNRATGVFKAANGSCVCQCMKGFGGADCGRCADGYINYPTCTDNCTHPNVSCGAGKATAVTGVILDGIPWCVCTCVKNYVGRLCDTCAIGFSSGGWPQCGDDCSSYISSCNNHGWNVQKHPSGEGCLCNCSFGFGGNNCERCAIGYEGSKCDRCTPGFSVYPFCQDDCTNKTSSCSGHAISVGGTKPNCYCHCLPGWGGNRCERCALGYTGANCDTCSIGYGGGFPVCIDQCTNVGVSCNARANLVGGEAGNCTCGCITGWAGQRCEYCDRGYAGVFCDNCAGGFVWTGLACVDACTQVDVSCHGFARAVTRLSATSCLCNCIDRYVGTTCEKCAQGYDVWPTCRDDCTLPSVSCINNATSVRGTYPNCICDCVHPFSGTRCETCLLGFTGPTCNQCSEGFDPPLCQDNCTSVNISCYSRANGVGGPKGDCMCACFTGFTGNRCEKCDLGYAGWPDCRPACTNTLCNNRAVQITGTFPNCTCVCAPQYTGSKCEICAKQFAGPNCTDCAFGYINPPNCVDGCISPDVSCFGNAVAVGGNYPFCVCQCKRGYTGTNCGGCAYGFADYPYCSDTCTVKEVSCNGTRTENVTGVSPFCICNCKTGFGGPRCDSCAYGFTGSNCEQCSPGFTVYGTTHPDCRDDCTDISISCNGVAYPPVTGSNGNCACNCIHRFTGPRCTECARGFTGARCDSCLPGFINYPECKETCTVPAVSCSGHGVKVTGSFPDCVCECKIGWTGLKCNQCAIGYTSSNCSVCAVGYEGYPFCVDACTKVNVSCSNNAYAVRKADPMKPGDCICDCKPQYALPRCGTCFKSYTGTNCDSCATGFVGYPDCKDNCSNASVSCNGIGLSVEMRADTGNGTCRCTCPPRYGGNRCEFCAFGFNDYPKCVEDCTNPAVSCSDHATSVLPGVGQCDCNCTKKWTGVRCEKCAKEYNNSAMGCNVCAFGYTGYPDCVDACKYPEVSCLGFGTRVRGDPGNCTCVCSANYTGVRCEVCATGYVGWPVCVDGCFIDATSCNGLGKIWPNVTMGNCTCSCPKGVAGRRCERCEDGYAGWPNCQEACTSVNISCNTNAVSVSGTYPNCLCRCKTGFAGERCHTCDTGYSPYPLCWDDCTNALASCGGRATAVNSTAQGCKCDCFVNFTGMTCNSCAPGYHEFPNCTESCTNVSVSCGPQGLLVSPFLNKTCNCTCRFGWAGARCQHCAPGFAGAACDRCDVGYFSLRGPCDTCSTGYTGWPCKDACTDPTISCTANARSVEPIGTAVPPASCKCNCYHGFTSARCDTCAFGFIDYPTCTDLCLNVYTSCNGQARWVQNTSTVGACLCDCFARIGGYHCERCEDGFIDYPRCEDNCTNTFASCNGHAVGVQFNTSRLPPGQKPVAGQTPCECWCTRGYNGTTCNQCARGFSGYPNCTDACVDPLVSCHNRGISVSRSDVNASSCTCVCARGYDETVQCGGCAPGYSGYPFCEDDCTAPSVSCFDHATAVAPIYKPDTTEIASCKCTCRSNYNGPSCQLCASGYELYPNCTDACTLTSVSCNSGATSVQKRLPKNLTFPCTCQCMTGLGGERCERCSEGYNGYPQCEPACNSVPIFCEGNAHNVSGTFPDCKCQCFRGFEGRKCDRCALGFANYPTCQDNCTAAQVTCPASYRMTGRLRTMYWPNCACECMPTYGGNMCDRCQFGYGGYPNCTDNCSDPKISCNGRGISVSLVQNETDNATRCICGCPINYAGDRCERCAPGFDFYPRCIDVCTHVNASCKGRAKNVSGSNAQCLCDCEVGLAGNLCERCAPGYNKFPTCSDGCTLVDVSCGGTFRAKGVRSNPNATNTSLHHCLCDCRPAFSGPQCDECAPGHTGFPNCTDNCTIAAVSCNGANSVRVSTWPNVTEGPTNDPYADVTTPAPTAPRPHCNCECKTQYAGPTCNLCNFGFAQYPKCFPDCTDTKISCNAHAFAVAIRPGEPNPNTTELRRPPRCDCVCFPNFNGSLCDQCSDGYVEYPTCYDNCTNITVSCNDHAITVEQDGSHSAANPKCLCTCEQGYVGSRCERCDDGYTQEMYLGPDASYQCVDNCSNAVVSCNGHADSVSHINVTAAYPQALSGKVPLATLFPNGTRCRCKCTRGFGGILCDSCSIGFSNYPFCEEDCTNLNVSCSGNALSIYGAAGSCKCTCKAAFSGSRCDRCAPRHVGYPNCVFDISAFPKPRLELLTQSEVDESVVRTGFPYSERIIRIRPIDDTFDRSEATRVGMGVEVFFFQRCVTMTFSPDDSDYPLGFANLRGSIWTVASVASVTPTEMSLRFIAAQDLLLSTDITITFSINGSCFTNGVNPQNSVKVLIRREPAPIGVQKAVSGFSAAAAAISIVSMNGLGAAAGQSLGVLGTMACSRGGLRGAAQPAAFLASPLGFWYPTPAMRVLGAFLAILVTTLVNFFLLLAVYFGYTSTLPPLPALAAPRVRKDDPEPPRPKSPPTTFWGKVFSDDTKAIACFPGASLFFLKVFGLGALSNGLQGLMTGDTTDLAVGIIVVILWLVGFIATIVWTRRQWQSKDPLENDYAYVPRSDAHTVSTLYRWCLPTNDLYPLRRSMALLPLLFQVRAARFAAFDLFALTWLYLITSFRPAEAFGCVMQYGFAALWCLALTIATIALRPFRTNLQNASFTILQLALTLVASAAAAGAHNGAGLGADGVYAGTIIVAVVALLQTLQGLALFLVDYSRMLTRFSIERAEDNVLSEKRRVKRHALRALAGVVAAKKAGELKEKKDERNRHRPLFEQDGSPIHGPSSSENSSSSSETTSSEQDDYVYDGISPLRRPSASEGRGGTHGLSTPLLNVPQPAVVNPFAQYSKAAGSGYFSGGDIPIRPSPPPPIYTAAQLVRINAANLWSDSEGEKL